MKDVAGYVRCRRKEYPPWQTVYYWFRLWRKDGTLEHIRQVLVNRVREQRFAVLKASAYDH